jgi:hypothetical protein
MVVDGDEGDRPSTSPRPAAGAGRRPEALPGDRWDGPRAGVGCANGRWAGVAGLVLAPSGTANVRRPPGGGVIAVTARGSAARGVLWSFVVSGGLPVGPVADGAVSAGPAQQRVALHASANGSGGRRRVVPRATADLGLWRVGNPTGVCPDHRRYVGPVRVASRSPAPGHRGAGREYCVRVDDGCELRPAWRCPTAAGGTARVSQAQRGCSTRGGGHDGYAACARRHPKP